MITYTTKINKVRCADQAGLPDVVKQVEFTLSGEDSGCKFDLPGVVKFDFDDSALDPASFVQFSSLTEEQVLSWLESSPVFGSVKSHVAMVVERMVAEAALAPKPLPWAPEPSPDPAPIAP